jgi:cell division protein FtsB
LPDVPGVPSAEELALLPHGELAVRLSGAYQLIAQMAAQVEQAEALTAQVEESLAENARLAAQVEALERQVARDSGNSSNPSVVG